MKDNIASHWRGDPNTLVTSTTESEQGTLPMKEQEYCKRFYARKLTYTGNEEMMMSNVHFRIMPSTTTIHLNSVLQNKQEKHIRVPAHSQSRFSSVCVQRTDVCFALKSRPAA
jgi:hypothetical protein